MKIAVRRTPSTSQKSSADPSWSLIRLVSPTGMTKKRPIASARESAIVSPQTQPPISSGSPSSSSSSCALAEIASALKPIFIDSPRATTPRMIGSRQRRLRFAQGTSDSEVSSTAPSGLRTATAQVETPRIITPSSTACPPTGASRLATRAPSGMRSGSAPFEETAVAGGEPPSALTVLRAPSLGVLGGAALEALDTAAGIDQLLLSRVERMALGAELDVQVVLGGAGVELVPARAVHVGEDVVGMDLSLHRRTSLEKCASGAAAGARLP